MAIRGPKPLPGGLKVLKGRDHHKKKEPIEVPLVDCLALSEDLAKSLPAEVLARAQNTLVLLADKKVLGQCDMEAFERYCQHLYLAHEANRILREEGVISVDEDGVSHKHPATQIHRDNSLAALRYEEQFGLTPSARQRLTKTDEQKKEDEYAQYRRRAATG